MRTRLFWMVWVGLLLIQGCGMPGSSARLPEFITSAPSLTPTSTAIPFFSTTQVPRTFFRTTSSSETIRSCPISQPGLEIWRPFSPFPIGNYRNASGTLLTFLGEGPVLFYPGGAGAISADGSMSIKWVWYRHGISGSLSITGHRLDAPAPPLKAGIPSSGYGRTGVLPTILTFPTEGCWEVIGRVGRHTLAFITLVVKTDLELPYFTWWPAPPDWGQVDYQDLPYIWREYWAFTSAGLPGRLTLETRHAPPSSLPSPSILSVRGFPAICIREDRPTRRVKLRWKERGFQIQLIWEETSAWVPLRWERRALDCPALQAIAESLRWRSPATARMPQHRLPANLLRIVEGPSTPGSGGKR